MTRISTLIFLAVLASACPAPTPGGDHGHDHGGGGHGEHGEHGEHEQAGETLAITRWTTTHELFVEIDAPIAGASFAYHAHVTRLNDNHPATSGTLTIRFEQDGFPAESHTDEAVSRPGIFASEAPAPAQPGTYDLVFTYADGDERAAWDAGRVAIGATEPVEQGVQEEGEIPFLKEAQWQIPFRVWPAETRAVAPVLSASGVVRPAPQTTAMAAAPADGLLVWSDTLPAVGRRVTSGDRLALLLPAGAAEHGSTLLAEKTSARVDRDLAEIDLRRVERLEGGELVSARRLDQARADLARAQARVASTQRRLAALSSEDAGAIPIRAPSDGLLVAVGGRHGEVVRAGEPLVTVAAGDGVLIDARAFARDLTELEPIASLSLERAGAASLDLLALGATVLTERLVFDPRTLSAPLLVSVPPGSGLRVGDLIEVEVGVGSATPRLTVPRTAVVEINGQDIVFVQKTGESFTRRRVALGDRDATHVVVEGGVEAGEMLVVEGGFDIHVASLSGALESHKH